MHKAAVSIAAVLIAAAIVPASARDRDNQSLGAEMSRERAESRIDRIKNDRADKESQRKREQDRAKAQARPAAKSPAKDPARP